MKRKAQKKVKKPKGVMQKQKQKQSVSVKINNSSRKSVPNFTIQSGGGGGNPYGYSVPFDFFQRLNPTQIPLNNPINIPPPPLPKLIKTPAGLNDYLNNQTPESGNIDLDREHSPIKTEGREGGVSESKPTKGEDDPNSMENAWKRFDLSKEEPNNYAEEIKFSNSFRDRFNSIRHGGVSESKPMKSEEKSNWSGTTMHLGPDENFTPYIWR